MRRMMHRALALMLVAPLTRGGLAETPQAAPANHSPFPGRVATVENPLTKLEIDGRGQAIALIEKRSGRNLLAQVAPLATVQVQGKVFPPTACSWADGKLRFEFASGARAVIGCFSRPKYLAFTVIEVEGDGVESLAFLALTVPAGKHTSSTSGAVVEDAWGVCLRALNLQTQVSVGGGPCTLRASCMREYGLSGSKAGLVVAAADQLRPALQEMARGEGVPQSSLGGPWALDAEAPRGSYVFAHPSEREVERWIDLAQRAGFTHLHYDGWYRSLGHYEPNPALFPNGLEGMKNMVRKVHAAGLKAGLHTLTGCIQPHDPWVSPVPDKRLAADASYTLAADVDEKSDMIVTLENPQPHDVIWSYSGRGNALRVNGEIIQYAAISFSPPYGFLKCTRGAFHTKPAAHRKGDQVDHLRQVYLAFYPDERSTLVDEVAEAIARVYNECEFDQIYMDGAEGMGTWHAIQTMRDAIYRRLQRPALVEASCWDHWSWYYHSRIGAWDHPKWGLKPFTDLHCASLASYRQGSLLQAQLGWWAVLGPSASNRGQMPDEMEYLCCKALAFDAPFSLQGIGSLAAPANARMQEYLTMAGWYERLRRANYFPDSLKEQLRQPGQDFHLTQADDGQWQLSPADYLAHKVRGLDGGTEAWSVTNRFQAQPLAVRLEALYAVAPYDSPDGVLIADAASADRFTVRRAAPRVTQSLARATDQVKVGDASLRFSATSQRASRRGAWAHAGMRFEPPYFSIQPCDALGLWIHGDGKGEVLNLQLTTPREYMQAFAEHYVTIDFSGWRYFEIPLRERDAARHRDYEWPYSSMSGIYMVPLNRNHISEVNLYLNNLPPNETATVHLSPIKALRTSRVPLGNPALTVNGHRLSLPGTLRSGEYLEVGRTGECRAYDERGALVRRLALPGAVPLLRPGENRLAFSCDPPEGFAPRAEITAIAYGPPLSGRAPAAQVHWELLRDEYDVPHAVTQLDGKDNSWDVICRKGERSVPFGVEMDVEQVAQDARRGGPAIATLRNPAVTIGDKRLRFPAELFSGDRLVFDGARCRLHRKAQGDVEWIQPQGGPATLDEGRHRAVLSFDGDPLPQFRVAVSLVKHYAPRAVPAGSASGHP